MSREIEIQKEIAVINNRISLNKGHLLDAIKENNQSLINWFNSLIEIDSQKIKKLEKELDEIQRKKEKESLDELDKLLKKEDEEAERFAREMEEFMKRESEKNKDDSNSMSL